MRVSWKDIDEIANFPRLFFPRRKRVRSGLPGDTSLNIFHDYISPSVLFLMISLSVFLFSVRCRIAESDTIAETDKSIERRASYVSAPKSTREKREESRRGGTATRKIFPAKSFRVYGGP